MPNMILRTELSLLLFKEIKIWKQKLKEFNETTSLRPITRKVFKCTNGCPRTFSTAAKRTEHFETSKCSDFLYK